MNSYSSIKIVIYKLMYVPGHVYRVDMHCTVSFSTTQSVHVVMSLVCSEFQF